MRANIDPLAYATAKTYGLQEECDAILEHANLTEDDIKLASNQSHLPEPPRPVAPGQSNWPLLPTSRSILEKALTEELGTSSAPLTNGYGEELDAFEEGLKEPQETRVAQDDMMEESWGEEAGDGAAEWEMGEADEIEDVGISAEVSEAGVSDAEYWVRNSPLAADHIADGSFETAMQLLNRQVGAVNFEPLKPRFLQLYQVSRTFLEANPGLAPLQLYIRRNHDLKSQSLPRLLWDYEKIKTVEMRDALKLVTANKLEESIVALREILFTLLLSATTSQSIAKEAAGTVDTIREYIVGLSVEIARRNQDVSTPEGVKRNLELAAYFTNFQLTPQHRGLALMQAMTQFNKYKNIATAGVFAQKYVALGVGRPDAVDRVRPLKATTNQS